MKEAGMRIKPSYLHFLLLILIVPAVLSAYPLEKANVVAAGGGSSSAGGMYLHDTVGELFIGEMAIPNSEIGGGYWYVIDQIHIGPTSAVTITGFTVAFSLDGVVLRWTIGDSDGLVGFNVYRSSQADDGFLRINDVVIAADIGNEYLDASVRPGAIYHYRLGAIDRDGEFLSAIAEVRVPVGEVTLYQNYPNPFNPRTTISFYLPKPSHTILTIFDTEGRQVAELLDEPMSFGKHEILWDGRNNQGNRVSTGVYFYKFQAGKKVITKKLTVLK